jgi:hypothetical protein
VAAAATKTSGTTGAGVTPGIEAVAVGRAGTGDARWVGVWLGLELALGLGLGLVLGLWVDADGLASDAELAAEPELADCKPAATAALDAAAELAATGLEGADEAAVAWETGAELTDAAVLCALRCPLVHPATSASAATHRSDAPRNGVICSG